MHGVACAVLNYIARAGLLSMAGRRASLGSKTVNPGTSLGK